MSATLPHTLRRARSCLLSLSRKQKRRLQIAIDLHLIWLALWLAFHARLEFPSWLSPFYYYSWLFIAAPLITLPIFIRMGLYRTVIRYLGRQGLSATAEALTMAAILLAIVMYFYDTSAHVIPRSIIIIYWMFSLLLIGGIRIGVRYFLSEDSFRRSATANKPTRSAGDDPRPLILIYGAGAAGNQLLTALRMSREMTAAAFIDDNPDLAGLTIAGLPIYAPADIPSLLERVGIKEILLAIPSASRCRRNQIMDMLSSYPIQVRTVPGMMDLASGRIQVADLRPVDITDLLGRAAVGPNLTLLKRCIDNSVVMVTGAGGSIGSELCRQISRHEPRTLILYEHSEFNLYQIHAELTRNAKNENTTIEIIPIIGSVCNPHRLQEVMQTWNVDTVYHAAAYKHVPMVEGNIAEGIVNNTFGTLHTAQAAISARVKNFVLISTDKAVRPTNIMGGSKRLAELILQALASQKDVKLYGGSTVSVPNRTRFTMVRFGNVLGSSGSVIPLFHAQIKKGGPVTVTHPEITRYFMTILEAAQLVIQAGSMGEGGDVFVLNMGDAVKIADLATKMIRLSGLSVRSTDNPDGDIAIQYTGLRPGEKLYEELLIGHNGSATEHPMIMRAAESYQPWPMLKIALKNMEIALRSDDCVAVRNILTELVEGFHPDITIVDNLHVRRAASSTGNLVSESASWLPPEGLNPTPANDPLHSII